MIETVSIPKDCLKDFLTMQRGKKSSPNNTITLPHCCFFPPHLVFIYGKDAIILVFNLQRPYQKADTHRLHALHNTMSALKIKTLS